MIPDLGLINLLEWLTECREMVYLLGYQFFKKGTTQERPDGRDA